MHSLFFKIFLWLWLTLLAIGGGVVLAQRYWAQEPPLPTPRELQAYAGELDRLYQDGGAAAVEQYLQELIRETGIALVLVEPNGRPLRGQRLPAPVRRAVGRVLVDAREGRHSSHWYRTWQMNLDEQPHLLISWRPHWERRLPPWFRPAIALTVTALVSLLLAALFSRPIRRVRDAARRFAEGELDARVPVPQGWRRHDELARLGHDFNAMAGRIQALLEAQNRLLRDVSHELRSPLARLQVALGLLRQKRAQGAADADIDRMELEIERLDALIGQVLSLSRMEAGAVQPARKPMELNALLTDIAEDADFEAQPLQKNVRFSGDEPLTLTADPALLRSAVENVVRNAVRATAPGTDVQLSLHRDGNVAEIRVRDHGPGVPEDKLQQLFEPFFRVGEARERDSGGYGLGLAIAARAMSLHGGSVRARNASDGGLEVILRLKR